MLGASGSFDLGLRAEARGLDGGPPGSPLVEPVPYLVEPTAELAGLLAPRLEYTAWLAPRLLLLSGPAGGREVHSADAYVSGSTALTWRADARTRLTLALAAARGTLAMSPLTQLATSAAPSSDAAPPSAGALDPTAGVRTGGYATAALRGGVGWRATSALSLEGTAGGSRSGGVGNRGRALFPATDTLFLEAQGMATVSTRDAVGLQLGASRTRLLDQGPTWIVDSLARWSRRLVPRLDGLLALGAATTRQGSSGPGPATGWRVDPRADLTLTRTATDGGRGAGFSVHAGYAPYFDPYGAEVLQRFGAEGRVSWPVAPRLRLGAAFSGAVAVGAGGTETGAAALELGAWLVSRDREVGLTLSGGWQEPRSATAALRQWSVGLVVGGPRTPAE